MLWFWVVLGCLGYYVGTRAFLMLDCIFVEKVDPFEPLGYRRAEQFGVANTTVPMRLFVWPLQGDWQFVCVLFKWLSMAFGLVGKPLWRAQVRRTEEQERQRQQAERIRRRVESARREAEERALAELEKEVGAEVYQKVQALLRDV